ncbi:UbiA prenyltransferase family protein [Plantactinospora veratri]
MVRAVPAALTVAAHTYTVTELSRREVSGATRALPAATLAGTAAVAAAAVTRCTEPARRTGRRTLVPAALAGWYGLQYGTAQARVAADPQASRVRAAVGAGITGLPALQGALVARTGATLLGVAVAAAAPIGRRLARLVSPT